MLARNFGGDLPAEETLAFEQRRRERGENSAGSGARATLGRMPIERSDAGRRVLSPCVRNCCLDTDDVCLGCFRTLGEICGWSASTDAERLEILARCAQRREAKTKERPHLRDSGA